jgi:hypothetical protein
MRLEGDLVTRKAGLSILTLLLLAAPAAAEVEPALSAEVGGPLKLSANVGIWVGHVGEDGAEQGRGFLLQAQPGLGGLAFNLGWTPLALPGWGTQAVGLVVKARYLRTWGDPWGGLEPDQDFLGAELGVAWIVKVSAGVLTRVGSGEGKDTVFTWSVGVGL